MTVLSHLISKVLTRIENGRMNLKYGEQLVDEQTTIDLLVEVLEFLPICRAIDDVTAMAEITALRKAIVKDNGYAVNPDKLASVLYKHGVRAES